MRIRVNLYKNLLKRFFYHEKEALEAMYNYATRMYRETTLLIKILLTDDDYFKIQG